MNPVSSLIFLILVGSCFSSVTSIYPISFLRPYQPLVQEFAAGFIDKIVSTPKYFNAFSIQNMTSNEASKLFYGFVLVANHNIGDRDPQFSAVAVHQAVEANFDVLSSFYVVEVTAYTAGEHLFQSGFLNTDNQPKLSNDLFKSIAKYIDLIDVSKRESVETNYAAIKDGILSFMASCKLYDEKNACALAATFSQVWYVNRL